MRILSCCYEFPPIGGGGGAVAHGLSKALAADGYEVDIVTMGFRCLPDREVSDGVRVYRVPTRRKAMYHCSVSEAASYLLPARRALRELLYGNRYDLLHAHFIFPDGLLAAAAAHSAGLPFLVTAHGSDVPGYNPHRLHAAHALLAPVWRNVVRRAARIICPSETLRRLVSAACPEARTAVIPNGIDPASFRPDRERRRRILVATRMLERKGIQHILNALHATSPEYELHVVGDGPFLPTLRRLARNLGVNTVFHGWLSNRSSEYRELFETSSIFALPSEAENFPVVLLEAMAAGLAIVTSEGTGCAEVVGNAARLVPPKDPAAIRAALLALIHDPECCQELGRTARDRVEKHFGWRIVASRYADVFRTVVTPDRVCAGQPG